MFYLRHQNISRIVIVFLAILVIFNGHEQCVNNVHVDQESNSYYRSFMQLDTIGVSQCIKMCKRYKLCKKIHHNREQLTCDLMMTYEEKGTVTSLLDVAFDQSVSHNCGSCSEKNVCVGIDSGSYVCLDQDECSPADWVPLNHKCYHFEGGKKTADSSIVFCGNMDSTLVRIYNASILNFLESQMQSRGISLLWIAANDRDVEGDWVWGPGDVVKDAVWKDGEPNNVNDEDCASLKFTSIGIEWEDLRCGYNGDPCVACERPYKMLP